MKNTIGIKNGTVWKIGNCYLMIIGYIRNVGVKDTLYGIRRYDQNDDSFENGRVYDQAYYGRKILEEWKRVTDPVELKMIKLLLML